MPEPTSGWPHRARQRKRFSSMFCVAGLYQIVDRPLQTLQCLRADQCRPPAPVEANDKSTRQYAGARLLPARRRVCTEYREADAQLGHLRQVLFGWRLVVIDPDHQNPIAIRCKVIEFWDLLATRLTPLGPVIYQQHLTRRVHSAAIDGLQFLRAVFTRACCGDQ